MHRNLYEPRGIDEPTARASFMAALARGAPDPTEKTQHERSRTLPGQVSRLGLGTIPAADLAHYSGLELLRRMIDGHYPAPPMAGLMNFGLVEAEEGRAVFQGRAGRKPSQPARFGAWRLGGDDHGFGARLLRADGAREGRGLHHRRVQGEPHPAHLAQYRRGDVRGAACPRGRTLAVSEASLKDAAGKLLAFGTETCSIFPMERMARG
jgi:hypothetical protein